MNMDQEYLKTLTVLYVEDDNDIREQFREFLLRLVGTLVTAANGAEGLNAFVEHAPDIVITDILMPGIDGLTMACKIRELVRTVPIIVLTAFEQTDYLKRAIDIGVDKYVSKPVNSGFLLEGLLDCCHWLRAEEQEEQLKQKQDRKIESMRMKHNETIVTLAGGMAHDYNNLLQVIMGYISLVKTEIEPHSRCTDYLEKVDGFLTETYELGQRLIFLGDGSREEPQYGPIMALVQETIKAALTDFSVTVVLDTHEEDPIITFFESQLCFVFSKLAANALEAMSAGGTLYLSSQIVTITDQLPLVPGTYLHITLSDTGSGISRENLLKIFDPYFSTKQRCSQKGMGLSLALCHTIIVKHGGIITVESAIGSGTTFHVWLPIHG
jgi:signal transduction histidine kinase